MQLSTRRLFLRQCGIGLGALALGQKGILDKHCGTAVGQTDKASCDPTGLDASSNAQSMALGSTIGFAVGGAAAATALVLLFTEPKAGAPKVGAPKTGSSGQWVSAGVLSVGPAGAMMGARGAW